MIRFLMFVLTLALAVGLPVLCGFSLLEALLILLFASLGLGFLGWIIQGFRPNLLRCLLFWWMAMLFDKPEWLYPD